MSLSMKNIIYLIGDSIRSTGKSLDKLGCNLQGNYSYMENLSRHSRVTPLRGKVASLGKESFIAPSSCVIGNVEIGTKSSVWYNTVLRADVNSIVVGNETVISDRTVVHCSSENGPKGAQPTVVGNRVFVGPGAILHACVIEDDVYIGPGSAVFDGAVVEKGAHLEAGSLVTAGKRVPANQIWGGSPARFVREISSKEKEQHSQLINDNSKLAQEHDAQTSKPATQLYTEQREAFAKSQAQSESS
ncbi:hypothetical protein SAMD00019534_080130 [Acytostelium subglobosum LB1]|uniref:hypothetical protein n=1 Tax=Acytostelium subglobosum LB1 TaxID=1410327 RepID=UPI0006447F2F|nr:hypothetical protein SAMD00019534_080130 [Acytostelium subglobosum LB1]GAM24838.1 hypothetical protein SAMD00019534_080130 [Acytostelium subglobosum LB1]|eukprot:XP_012752507.1 hypothetical protein SAMD00019534_080130 [Acytostelium subglobosum LB1]